MIALTHAEKAAEAHDRIGDAAGAFADHEVVDVSETLALSVVNRRPFDFVRGDEICRLVVLHRLRTGSAHPGPTSPTALARAHSEHARAATGRIGLSTAERRREHVADGTADQNAEHRNEVVDPAAGQTLVVA